MSKDSHKTKQNKKRLIAAMRSSLGIVTTACKKADVSRKTFYRYKRKDPEFKKAINEVDEIAIDFVESHLFECIKQNKETSIIFFLKTRGKSRGYAQNNIGNKKDISDFAKELKSTGVEARKDET